MNYEALVQSITTLHADSAGRAAAALNHALVLRNWLIGAFVVEFEQYGEDGRHTARGCCAAFPPTWVPAGSRG